MVAARRNDRVAVVVYDRLTTLEYAIPTEVFGLPRPELAAYYEMMVVGAEPGPMHAAFGLTVTPERGLDALADVGTVVIPGWRDRFERPPTPLLDALIDAHAIGVRLVSICSGAFVLAATGLLDGRRATTHWMYADDLRRLHPEVDVDDRVLFVDNGSILTAAGSAAGLDACLHLVREDWGAATATTVARRLVVSPQRFGGQAQFIAQPLGPVGDTAANGEGIAELLDEVRASVDRRHTVSSMARRLHMSTRTFNRRFHAAMGTSPADWLARQRMERARELLETTDATIERIAEEVGFGAAVSLRQQFRRRLHTTPTAYRAQFAMPRPLPGGAA